MNDLKFLSPVEILDELDVHGDMQIADFGSGSGHFSIESAKKLGENGKVYAFDVQAPALETLRSAMQIENVSNIEVLRADLEKQNATELKERIIDLVILSTILFQSEQKSAIIDESYRVLKDGGHAAVIEWKENTGTLGPPAELKISKSKMESLMLSSGFKLVRTFNAGSHHYGLLFKKHEQ